MRSVLGSCQEVCQINQDHEHVADPARGSALRVAVSSSSAELHPLWAWGLTLTVVVAGGVLLYAARAAMGSALDHWLPRLEREAASLEAPAALPAPEPAVEEAVEPGWTYIDIEAAIRPLPESTEALIAEGRGELSEFSDLNSTDRTRALLIRNRWRLWGKIWHNRVEHARRPMPPAAACDIHAALEPTCRAVRASLAILDRVPDAGSTAEAEELLDEAYGMLEQLRQSPEPEEGPTPQPGSAVP